MRFAEGVLELAARRRRKLFDRLGDDVGVVVALDPTNQADVSGCHSMTDDVAPAYRSAAVGTRDGVALVVGVADAGPALEFVADPRQLYRYGTFFFASAVDGLHFSAEGPAFATFADALSAAVAAAAPTGGPVAVDRPDPAVVVPGRHRWQAAADAFVASRATKLAGEIERMRAATALAEAGIRAIAAEARVGSTEWELAALIGHEMMRGGAVPRFVVVTSGHRSALKLLRGGRI